MKKKETSILHRFWAWLLPCSDPPPAVATRPVSPPLVQEGAILPCQGGAGYAAPPDDEIDLYQLWQVLYGARRFILLCALLPTVAAVLITLYVLPVTYKSEAVLVPTDTQGGSLGARAGLAGNMPGSGKSDLILTFLLSRNLKHKLIEKYNLLPRWHEDIFDARNNRWLISEAERKALTVAALQRKKLDVVYTTTQDKKTNLVSLSWEDKDPAFAAEMIRRVIGELTHYLDNEYETDATRDRQFVEKQLARATRDLEHWERRIPTAELSLAEIQRERFAAQTVYAELRKQLELAKITEAKEVVRFKVLDPPLVPEMKFKPKRSLICALTLMAGTMLAVLFVFVRQAAHTARRERESG